jgi:hypothetical protein
MALGVLCAYLLSFVLKVALALGISRRAVIPISRLFISEEESRASRCGPMAIVKVIEGLTLTDLGSKGVTCAFKVLTAFKFIMSRYTCWP